MKDHSIIWPLNWSRVDSLVFKEEVYEDGTRPDWSRAFIEQRLEGDRQWTMSELRADICRRYGVPADL